VFRGARAHLVSLPSGLPIDAALPQLCSALSQHGAAVLQAPPGAGKSTVVPLALLAEPWAAHKRLVMLEPRRLATRAVARRMAATLGEGVGETVGYRMRLDSRISRATRIEVVTEGVLARMLQEDPALENIAAVIFDEFHERSLQADLALALLLDARANLTPTIKILVMSATLDVERVAAMLDAPVVATAGRLFPVKTHYAGRSAPAPAVGRSSAQMSSERLVARLVQSALTEESGDILVFLPGAREIRRVQEFLESAGLDPGTRVRPLYGDLASADQDAALAPAAQGTRKIVLATNIAETSLTIDGVRIVVDSGLVRRLVFDPATGMSRLETERISRASADQRQGRAGRLAPGVCYRAWSAEAQKSFAPFTPPEILAADLAPLALDLALWGVRDAQDLKWLDAPPAAMLGSAQDLLARLDAIDAAGRITAHGRRIASLTVHPRLAHMLLRASARAPLAAMLAALLSERDLLRGAAGGRDTDIRSRLDVLTGEERTQGADQAALQRSRRLARELARQLGAEAPRSETDTTHAGLLLAFAYPDRIGRRRAGSEARYTLANGRGAFFAEPDSVSRQEFIVAVDLDDRDRDARILLAAPVARADLLEHFAGRIVSATSVAWSTREEAVIARRVVKLDSLVLEEQPLDPVPPEAARAAMLTGVRALGLAALPWDREARDLQARMQFVRGLGREDTRQWPAVDDAALTASLEAWLTPWLDGVTRREHLARVPLAEALRALLSWDERGKLEQLAPSHLTVPSGSRIRIDYQDEGGPSVAVRLQEVFGLRQSPCIAGGAVRVTFKLLSPAQRPVQITRDLAGFWQGSYSAVRKDLRGRYPKHFWPENPLEAAPTRGARPKKA
jgi:ATP-dependent helicase HrpB